MTLIQLEEELKEARLRGAQDFATVMICSDFDERVRFIHVREVRSCSVNSNKYVGPAVVIS